MNDIKLRKDDVRPDIVFNDGRINYKSSVVSSFDTSSNYFRIHYDNTKRIENIKKYMMT